MSDRSYTSLTPVHPPDGVGKPIQAHSTHRFYSFIKISLWTLLLIFIERETFSVDFFPLEAFLFILSLFLMSSLDAFQLQLDPNFCLGFF